MGNVSGGWHFSDEDVMRNLREGSPTEAKHVDFSTLQ